MRQVDKFKWCVMETARFQVAEGRPRDSYGIFANRLKILLMEETTRRDVGILLKAFT